jgi:hypothetical protein
MRALPALTLLLVATGCGYTLTGGVRGNPNGDFRPFINEKVTIHGKFTLTGKPAPYVQTPGGRVYLVPKGSFSWGPDYQRLDGKIVKVTGIVHYRHVDQPAASEMVQPPQDYYFYFDAEMARIRLKWTKY